MEYLSWDLSILARATAYPNLSSASAHVGVSQPQLSRIVAKLEEQLGVPLLDRESRRKSSWTPAALRVAEIYKQTAHHFRTEIGSLASGITPRELKVGTLEGLVSSALTFCHDVLVGSAVYVVSLDVLDTSELEQQFEAQELDLIFTAHDLGARKYRHAQILGFQSLEAVDRGEMKVFSKFEYDSTSLKRTPTSKAFVSNSLRVREDWLERFGGVGTRPSGVSPKSSGKRGELTVMAVAHDGLPESFWDELKSFFRP